MCRSERSFNWASVVISMAVVTFFSLSGEGGATTSQESRAQTDDMFVDGSHFQPQKLAQVSDAERQSRELIGHKLLPEGARARSYAQKLVTACSGGLVKLLDPVSELNPFDHFGQAIGAGDPSPFPLR